MAYLDLVYSGKAKPQTLAALTGKSYERLDAEYRAFLQGLASQPTAATVDAAADHSGN